MKKIIKITVITSAYNEEKNIVNFINSIFEQSQKNFTLNNVWIFSDGSTDNTVKLAKNFKNKQLRVFSSTKRLGKAVRLNQAYTLMKDEILIQADADIILSDKHTFENIVETLTKNEKVKMCGGNLQPVKGTTFTQKAVNCTLHVYQSVKNNFKNGNSVYTVSGALLGFKKEFIKNVKIPKDIVAEDVYLYFLCLQKKYIYRYSPKAIAYFSTPRTIKDQIKQNTRFMMSDSLMLKYFSKETVDKESIYPMNLILKEKIKMLLKHPILSLYIYMINKICFYKAKKHSKNLLGTWQIAESTKLITN